MSAVLLIFPLPSDEHEILEITVPVYPLYDLDVVCEYLKRILDTVPGMIREYCGAPRDAPSHLDVQYKFKKKDQPHEKV